VSDSAPLNEPKPDKPGKLGRLVDLGNHNRVIAIATLITLLTGVPFLVTSTWRALTGEESEVEETKSTVQEQRIATLERQLEETLKLANRQLEIYADEAKAKGTGGSARAVSAGLASLSAVAADARRPGATTRELNEVMEALANYSEGDPEPVLARLAEIAKAQELRDDPVAATETWCRRAKLRIFTDPSGALEDFERANSLSSATMDAYSHREHARLLRYNMRADEALFALRRARNKAIEEGDLYGEVEALSDLGWIFTTSFDGKPDFIAEQRRANLRMLELIPELLSQPENYGDCDLIATLCKVAGILGVGKGIVSNSPIEASADSPMCAALLRTELERLTALEAGAVSEVDLHLGRSMLTANLAIILAAMEETEGVATLAAEASEEGWAVLDHPDIAFVHLSLLQVCFLSAAKTGRMLEDWPLAVRSYAGNLEVCSRVVAAQDPTTTALLGMEFLGAWNLGSVMILGGDYPGGLAHLQEALVMTSGLEATGASAPAAAMLKVGLLFVCAQSVLPHDRDLALQWLTDGDALIVEQLVGTPEGAKLKSMPPWVMEMREELGMEPLDPSGE
jgi:tetratricopeptide (TPR) repeat protein